MITNESARTIMYEEGRRQALDLQSRVPELTGTEIIAEESKIPAFDPTKDYSNWEKGWPVTDEGQVWPLLIPHNAAAYPGTRPATNRACWSLAHTKDPAKAKPWVASYGISGLYMADECCTYPNAEGIDHVWRNLYENNEYPPLTLNAEDRWEDLGAAAEVLER